LGPDEAIVGQLWEPTAVRRRSGHRHPGRGLRQTMQTVPPSSP